MQVIPVFLFGTRGDILPIARILKELLAIHQTSYKLIVITHQCFRADIAQLHCGLEVRGVDAQPIASMTNDSQSSFHASGYVWEFKRSLLPDDAIACVMCNLFSLESVHLAFSTSSTCIVLHPTIPSAKCRVKRELLDEFATLQPLLHHHCQQNSPGGLDNGLLQYADYENWLWPTLAHEFDESAIMPTTKLLGPIVLILNSLRMSDPLQVHPRYHLCGAVACELQGEALHLEAMGMSGHNRDTAASANCGGGSSAIAYVDTTAAAVTWLAERQMSVRLGVDFGSMMPVLACDDRLLSLLEALCGVSTPIACVIICHGYHSIVEPILTTIQPGRTILNDFLLVQHSVDHSVLLPRCTALLHHGGIGTTNACMRAGVPQLVAPVMYDQTANGRRVEQLKLGVSVNFDVLFAPDAVPAAGTDPTAEAHRKGSMLERLLAEVTTPTRRLRCACVGRDVRADPAEDGLTNAVRIVRRVLSEALARATTGPSPSVDSIGRASVKVSGGDEDSGQEERELVVDAESGMVIFGNGVRVYAHVRTAPEETVFLYDEIFQRRVYGAFVEALRDGDLVVDAGANVGLFALYAAGVHLATSDAAHRKQLKLVAIEPIPENADLLCKNLALHRVDAVVYHCALCGAPINGAPTAPVSGAGGSGAVCEVPWHQIGEQTANPMAAPLASVRTKEMRYYPHIPGNSCSADSVARNAACQDRHMSQAGRYRAGAKSLSCPALSLSQVLAHYFSVVCVPDREERVGTKRCRTDSVNDPTPTAAVAEDAASRNGSSVPSIALLKVDVEGDELEALGGISPQHWRLVDRVVVEARSDLRADVAELLSEQGYHCGAVEDARTGNWLLFAQR